MHGRETGHLEIDWQGEMGRSGVMNWASKRMIGVVHLKALPGAPGWAGSMDEVCAAAIADEESFAQGGADALMVENFGNMPFTREAVAAETVAGMALAERAIREAGITLPLGCNVLRWTDRDMP
jgi:hypothetical protein